MSALQPKPTYQQLAQTHSFPFQSQPWWLDAVCGPDGWDVALAFDDQGELTGALPFVREGRKGLPIVQMPPLTAYFPVWMKQHATKQERQYHRENQILEALIDQLPNAWILAQHYDPSFTNGLPFYFKGFRLSTRYTYVLDDLSDPASIFRGMESSVRNHIRNAGKELIIKKDGTLDELYNLIRLTFHRQGVKAPFGFDLLKRADAVLNQRNMRSLYLAQGPEGCHAAAYVVFDGKKASFLLSGTHPAHRKGGALYLLLWQAIKDASKRTETFDFEGSMLPRVERVFRSFGARRVPYLRIVRYRNRFWHALAVLAGKNA